MADYSMEGRRTVETAGAGGAVESVGGLAAAVLGVLALIGVLPTILTQVAGIIFGAAFLVHGVTVGSRYRYLSRQVGPSSADEAMLGGGLGAEVLAGLAAVALGVLALIGVEASVLIPALLITGGAGLIISAGTIRELRDLTVYASGGDERARRIARGAVSGSVGLQILGGLGAIALGILALVTTPPGEAAGHGPLVQIGMIVLGVTLFFSGAASGGAATKAARK